MVTHVKCWIGIKIILILGFVAMHSYSGCNSPNGPYSITIDGGKTSVQDGETVSYMCTETPNVSGIPTPTWTLTPTGGGGNGLTAPSITTVGNVAQVQWFWHAEGGEVPSCTYELKCKTTEDCVATKTITVTVAREATTAVSVQTQVIPVLTNGAYHVSSYYSSTGADSPDLSAHHDDSQFIAKLTAHENVHYTDFYQGSQTPAAQESNRMIGQFLSDTGNDTTGMILSTFQLLRELTQEHVTETLLDPEDRYGWREQRAYDVSDLETPLHLFQQ